MKYPFIIFFRYDKYSKIDNFLIENKKDLLCSIYVVNNKEELNKLFNSNYQILVTYGENGDGEYCEDVNSVISDRMRKRWIHKKEITDVNIFNSNVNYCFVDTILENYEFTRPVFSLFTTCYNSYEKIIRAYDSIKKQTLKDWEWVILDDSPDDNHFIFLKDLFKDDHRIRLYKRSENNGSIGNVKNEAVSLCRGKYVIEMDHDDEILPDVLMDSKIVFDNDNTVGFIYMDFANIYENKKNFSYSDYFALGYSGYYRQKYNDSWVFVASTPNINNVTLSHIVSVPNHPRIWRKSELLKMGSYSEFLPVSDDYELLLRTAVNTKMAKIHKLGYIQYMNDGNNNFSLIRNGEINRLIYPIRNMSFEKNKINEIMINKDSYEDEKYCYEGGQMWKRKDFTHKYCNKIINMNYNKQYCIIGLENLYKNWDEINKLYNDPKNDFLLLDNIYSSDSSDLCVDLDNLILDRMKCYSMNDCTNEQLVKYFMLIYKSCDNYHIYNRIETNDNNGDHIDSHDYDIDDYDIDDYNSDDYNSDEVINEIVNSENDNKNDNKHDNKNDNKHDNKFKKITIITPCTRIENLVKIKESIKFEYINEWIIVYDKKKIHENPQIFLNDKDSNKISEYIYEGEGMSGNAQRNYGLDNIKIKNTYLYFLDDDNIIHPDLYSLLSEIKNNKIYTFNQKRPNDVYPYKEFLTGDNIRINNIDTSMFLVDYNLCKDIRWVLNRYNSDGIYIIQCYNKNKNNKNRWIYVNKVLSYYNYIC